MIIKENLVIETGTDFSSTISLKDSIGNSLNLTGYTANSQMRKWYTSNSYVSFTTNTLDTTGNIILTLTSTQTANISYGRYVYDVLLKDNSNNISKVAEGIVIVNPSATQ